MFELPPRTARTQHRKLVGMLETLGRQTTELAQGRVEGASRQIIQVQTVPNAPVTPEQLLDSKQDIRVAGFDQEAGIILLDSASSDLARLQKKLDEYVGTNRTVNGNRKNQPLVDAIEAIALARFEECKGPLYTAGPPGRDQLVWFEVVCRGGTRLPRGTSAGSRQQIRTALGTGYQLEIPEFEASEGLVLYLRLTSQQLKAMVDRVDCIYEFDLAPPTVINWLVEKVDSRKILEGARLTLPPENAPSAVLLDTGIATRHPLVSPILKGAVSVLPDDASAEDVHGHGSRMGGLAVYGDFAPHVAKQTLEPDCWLESSKILVRPNEEQATDERLTFWASLLGKSVERVEAAGTERNRIFCLAVTTENPQEIKPSRSSQAIDQLAFQHPRGRLFLVSIGNVLGTDGERNRRVIKEYPALNLSTKLMDPSQAMNAVTVGAYTEKTSIPPDPAYKDSRPVAPAGGICPDTRSNVLGSDGGAIKPDIVLEGGNIAIDPQDVVDDGIATLNNLTLSHNFLQRALTTFNGTSSATGLAANLAAKVWREDPSLRAETVRGLLVHSASWTQKMEEQFPSINDRVSICGYGVPNLELAAGCVRERATVVLEDEMPNTHQVDGEAKRVFKAFRLPVPEELLMEDPERNVGLRVTLSYFSEPNMFRRKGYRGLDLAWDMQGPQETEQKFLERINKAMREGDRRAETTGFPWTIGKNRRSRGTVQSDRWDGPSSFLAGNKLIAVYPRQGWWSRRPELDAATMRFSLIVTVIAPGLDVYTPIQLTLSPQVQVQT